MSLMNLVRWMAAFAVGWTLLAMGLGASGTRVTPSRPASTPSWEPATVEAMPMGWPYAPAYDLIDRASGRRIPIRLPSDDRWSDVAISPWRGPDGELEAVGRWVNPQSDDFGGWGVFRLSDGAVVSRIPTEILSTGRPCWVPGRERTILFAAGDGQLYRCRLTPENEGPTIRSGVVYASGRAEPSEPVAWEVAPPGDSEPMLTDPAGLADPRLKRWVFVAMRAMGRKGGRLAFGPSRIWWLELSDDARAIVAAGPLTHTTRDTAFDERHPGVAVNPGGGIRLVYLEQPESGVACRLRSSAVEIDVRTGRPCVAADGPGSAPVATDVFRSGPLLVSADGATVYGLSCSGQATALIVGPPRSR